MRERVRLPTMRNFLMAGSIFTCLAAVVMVFPGRQNDGTYLIPTGQVLSPAGEAIEVNDRPLGMSMSPDGKWLAVVTGSNFAPRALHLITIGNRELVQSIPLGDSFVGVAFADEGRTLLVGGGQDQNLKRFQLDQGRFVAGAPIPLAGSPSGLAIAGTTALVALNQSHRLALVDLRSQEVRHVEVGAYPYTVVTNGVKAWVSNWGGRRPKPNDATDGVFPVVVDPRTGIPKSGTVSVVDLASRSVVAEIETGLHPSAMALSRNGKTLYVANANSDSISVIDTVQGVVTQTLDARITPKAPIGSAPNALALSPDEKTLYVANGADNAVAVLDVASRKTKGFVPVGWYPTAVNVSTDGRQLMVASGYGFGSLAPAAGKGRSYKDRKGVISFIPVPESAELVRYTGMVRKNDKGLLSRGMRGKIAPIKHVFYVIKENRTYDQVFGDLPQGNGDPKLVQFGRDVTPNHHKLAEEFVLLDSFYTPADQSALGHRWCTQGYASDWVHKYSNGRNDQNPMLFAPNDFLWDAAKLHGVTVRSYGERGLNTIQPAKATWSDVYQDWKQGTRHVTITPRAQIVGLRDVYSKTVPAYGLTIPDQYRVDRFLEEFRNFEQSDTLPRLNVILLPQDHTSGTSPGFPTPRAMVADNDLALGRLVEAISKSRYWKDSVIFVTEDDAQSGLDHVDGHRTIGMVIGPHVRRKAVDSTFYTTIHMYRTIQHLLGLPPQNQFDLAAEPMFSVFTNKPDFAPYAALANRIPLDEMNPAIDSLKGQEKEMAEASLKMDFEEPDEAPADLLNRIIWHSVKGFSTPYPKRSGR
jgi:YVTN family beta-propeller protein